MLDELVVPIVLGFCLEVQPFFYGDIILKPIKLYTCLISYPELRTHCFASLALSVMVDNFV